MPAPIYLTSEKTIDSKIGSESFTINLPGGKKIIPPFGFDSAALIAAFIAASVSNMFEATLEQMATLAVLMTIY